MFPKNVVFYNRHIQFFENIVYHTNNSPTLRSYCTRNTSVEIITLHLSALLSGKLLKSRTLLNALSVVYLEVSLLPVM